MYNVAQKPKPYFARRGYPGSVSFQRVIIHCVFFLAFIPTSVFGASSTSFIEFSTSGPQNLFGNTFDSVLVDDFFGISDGRNGESNDWNFSGGLNIGGINASGSSSGRVGIEMSLTVDAGRFEQVYAPFDAGFEFTYADLSLIHI